MTTDANDVEALLGKNQQILDKLKKGGFVVGIEKFYANDVINEEPTGVMIKGKQAVIENEKNILQQVKVYDGIEVKSVGVGEDDGQGMV